MYNVDTNVGAFVCQKEREARTSRRAPCPPRPYRSTRATTGTRARTCRRPRPPPRPRPHLRATAPALCATSCKHRFIVSLGTFETSMRFSMTMFELRVGCVRMTIAPRVGFEHRAEYFKEVVAISVLHCWNRVIDRRIGRIISSFLLEVAQSLKC